MPGLGKISHQQCQRTRVSKELRRRHTRKLPKLIRQMSLVIKTTSESKIHPSRKVPTLIGRQHRLKPYNPRKLLRPQSNSCKESPVKLPRAQVHLCRQCIHSDSSGRPLNQPHRSSDCSIRQLLRFGNPDRCKVPGNFMSRHLQKSTRRLGPQPHAPGRHPPRRMQLERRDDLPRNETCRLTLWPCPMMHNQFHSPVWQNDLGFPLSDSLKRPGAFHPGCQMRGCSFLPELKHFFFCTSLQSS